LLVFFPDLAIALALKYSDQLPRPFSRVSQGILLAAVVCWGILVVVVGWFQLRSSRWRGLK